jgi:hypothetical protein
VRGDSSHTANSRERISNGELGQVLEGWHFKVTEQEIARKHHSDLK